MEIMGIQINTIIRDNVATRCDGCLEIIDGTPWRINLLDIVAAEAPVAWTDRPAINPGPFQFHGNPARSARSCDRWQSRARRAATGCATGSIATIMSSSPPEPEAAPLAGSPDREPHA
jgi:hypothetical protein